MSIIIMVYGMFLVFSLIFYLEDKNTNFSIIFILGNIIIPVLLTGLGFLVATLLKIEYEKIFLINDACEYIGLMVGIGIDAILYLIKIKL